MAQSDTIDVGPAAWVQLTNADAGVNPVVLLCEEAPVYVKATVGAIAPTSTDGAWLLSPGDGLLGTLAELWPGVPSATRVYARAQNFPARVAVSHA